MDYLLRGKKDYAAAYMDDVVVFSETWDDHMHQLGDILETLRKANLTAKPVQFCTKPS